MTADSAEGGPHHAFNVGVMMLVQASLKRESLDADESLEVAIERGWVKRERSGEIRVTADKGLEEAIEELRRNTRAHRFIRYDDGGDILLIPTFEAIGEATLDHQRRGTGRRWNV